MRWKISIEGADVLGEGRRVEFEIDKDLADLPEGKIGLSIEDGKKILSSLQQLVVEQECALYVLHRRHCRSCGGTRPIKDYATRTILTVFGSVTVRSPRLGECRRCVPGFDFTCSPLSEICPDRATPELMKLTAMLGALMPYRKAAEVLAEFLPGQVARRFTTLRHRTLAIGKRLEEKEKLRLLHERVDASDRPQLELPLPGDLNREFVLSIDTAHIPRVRGQESRSFEAVIGHASRGGTGGTLFAFSGTSQRRMRTEALMALTRLGYQGKGEITVISDGEDCLKRLKTALPQPATHILDWFHVAMKLRPLEQTAGWLSRQQKHDADVDLADRIAALKWRLWNGQADRALELVHHLMNDVAMTERDNPVRRQFLHGLKNLRTYIAQNRGSVANYGARYRVGQRIATTSAEASVDTLVARRMVKKQQCAGRNKGRTCSFRCAWPMPTETSTNASPTSHPPDQEPGSSHPSQPYPSSKEPHDPRELNGLAKSVPEL